MIIRFPSSHKKLDICETVSLYDDDGDVLLSWVIRVSAIKPKNEKKNR